MVLTTVNHFSDQVYDLTLSEASNHTDTLGITAYHPVYTEDRGCVVASELREGEVVRTEHGQAIVTDLTRQPDVFRVYNMTVEADHVYYVGDLTACVHNFCGQTNKHHIEPKYLGGDPKQLLAEITKDDHVAIHKLLDELLQNEFGEAVEGFGRNGTKWADFFASSPGSQDTALSLAWKAFQDVVNIGG